MGDYRLPWEPKPKPTYSHSPAKPGGPKPGDRNFIGPISTQQSKKLNISPSQYGSFMNTPGYNAGQAAHIKSKPDLDTNNDKLAGGGSNDNKVKVVNPSNFIETLTLTDPGYDSESKVEFNNLTTIEILEVSRSGNMSVDSRNLNRNIVDIVNVVNTFAPTEIVKLQKTSEDYFTPFEENLAENLLEITTIPGIAEVSVPQKDDNNILKAQVEILVPKRIHRDTIYI